VTAGSLPPGLKLSPQGAISGTPTTAGTYTFLVKSADSTNLSNAGYKQFVITATPIQVGANTLPNGTVSSAYHYAIPTSGATGTVTFQLAPGPLPPGISLSSSGALSGTPTASGQFPFDALISDSAGHTFVGYFDLSIDAPSSCSVSLSTSATVADAQALINEALGKAPAANDLNGDGTVNIIDVQIVINAVLMLGCTE
jgi:large repetitive protein